MKGRVLVTGASGFIGKPLVQVLVDQGWTVVAASRRRPDKDPGVADWIQTDLLTDDPRRLTAAARAEVLIHVAWIATPGIYGHSLENLDWLRTSAALSAAFLAGGGRRLVGAGTCLEYDRDGGADSTGPRTVYAAAKHACRLVFERQIAGVDGASLAWPRIFSWSGLEIIPTGSPRRWRDGWLTGRSPISPKAWSSATSSMCATAPAPWPPLPAPKLRGLSTWQPAAAGGCAIWPRRSPPRQVGLTCCGSIRRSTVPASLSVWSAIRSLCDGRLESRRSIRLTSRIADLLRHWQDRAANAHHD